MTDSYRQGNRNIKEAGSFDANDVVIGFDGNNRRTRGWKGSALERYFKSRVAVKAIEIDAATNIITLTNGDGTVVTGQVTN